MKNLNISKINQTQFHILVDKLMTKIEDNLDQYNGIHDIDYEIQNNVMIISFQNDNKIIINRQESLKEIWVATKSTGYYFKFNKNNWICNHSKKNFWKILEDIFIEYTKEKTIFFKKK